MWVGGKGRERGGWGGSGDQANVVSVQCNVFALAAALIAAEAASWEELAALDSLRAPCSHKERRK